MTDKRLDQAARPLGKAGLGARLWLVVIGALALLWLSVSLSASQFLQVRQPELALSFWSGNGFARANMAARILATSPTTPERARGEAVQAWRSEPIAVVASSILSATNRDAAAAQRGFAYARLLSRRDITANLYFIEAAVRRNDIPGALHEFDTALRTSGRNAPRLLFPILDDAMSQPGLAAPIGELLARDSEWVPAFVSFSIARGRNIQALAMALVYRPRTLTRLTVSVRRQLLATLVDGRYFEAAALVHWRLGQPNAGPVRDPGFDIDPRWPPFDWSIYSGGGYGAAILTDDSALRLYAEAGGGGTAARQLIRLSPGHYQLRAATIITPGAGAGTGRWSLICADRTSRTVATLPLPRREGTVQLAQTAFDVSADCPWQWLAAEVSNPQAGGRFEALVRDVAIISG